MNILLYILLHYTKTLLDVLFTSSGGHCFYSNIHTIIHEVNVSNEYECLWKNNATVRFIIGIPWLMIIDAIPYYPQKPILFLTFFIEVSGLIYLYIKDLFIYVKCIAVHKICDHLIFTMIGDQHQSLRSQRNDIFTDM